MDAEFAICCFAVLLFSFLFVSNFLELYHTTNSWQLSLLGAFLISVKEGIFCIFGGILLFLFLLLAALEPPKNRKEAR